MSLWGLALTSGNFGSGDKRIWEQRDKGSAYNKSQLRQRDVEVDLKLDIVPKLLLMAREIVNEKEPPKPMDNCKGICQWLEKIIKEMDL